MTTEGETWDKMMKKARGFQQEKYQLLPDWVLSSERDYVEKYIITAIHDKVIDSEVPLEENERNKINKIIEALAKYGTKDTTICFGLIYVTIITCESKTPTEEENIFCAPVFKIKHYIGKDSFEIWYIDWNCRTYKSWKDFLHNNQLPPGTMVYPHNGYYQADPKRSITESYSAVWCSHQASPAATQKLSRAMNHVTTLFGIVGLGVTAAALCTPVAPLIIGAAGVTTSLHSAVSAVNGIRSLVDRCKHKQSIKLTDADARKHWMDVAGSSLSVGLSGGSVWLVKAAGEGKQVSTMGRVVYNATLAGDATVKGVNVGCSVYSVYKKYKTDSSLDRAAVVNLATTLFLFGATIVNMKTAANVIKSTQGKMIETYKQSLSKKRFRNSFNRMQNKCRAKANNDADANNEIIRRIKKATAAKDVLNGISENGALKNLRSCVSIRVQNGVLKMDNFVLLDITVFIKDYVKPCAIICAGKLIKKIADTGIARYSENDNVNPELLEIMENLLQSFVRSGNHPETAYRKNSPLISKFNGLLRDMNNVKNAVEILPLLFKAAHILYDKSHGRLDAMLVEAMELLWHYTILNVDEYCRQRCIKLCGATSGDVILAIITVVVGGIDQIGHNWINAFKGYFAQTQLHSPMG